VEGVSRSVSNKHGVRVKLERRKKITGRRSLVS
jgi:hypothetical protein